MGTDTPKRKGGKKNRKHGRQGRRPAKKRYNAVEIELRFASLIFRDGTFSIQVSGLFHWQAFFLYCGWP